MVYLFLTGMFDNLLPSKVLPIPPHRGFLYLESTVFFESDHIHLFPPAFVRNILYAFSLIMFITQVVVSPAPRQCKFLVHRFDPLQAPFSCLLFVPDPSPFKCTLLLGGRLDLSCLSHLPPHPLCLNLNNDFLSFGYVFAYTITSGGPLIPT